MKTYEDGQREMREPRDDADAVRALPVSNPPQSPLDDFMGAVIAAMKGQEAYEKYCQGERK